MNEHEEFCKAADERVTRAEAERDRYKAALAKAEDVVTKCCDCLSRNTEWQKYKSKNLPNESGDGKK